MSTATGLGLPLKLLTAAGNGCALDVVLMKDLHTLGSVTKRSTVMKARHPFVCDLCLHLHPYLSL